MHTFVVQSQIPAGQMISSPPYVADVPVPPPPAWFRQSVRRDPVIRADKNVRDDIQQQRLLRRLGILYCGVMASAALHLMILVILGIWFFVSRPEPRGIVINCEILSEDAPVAEPADRVAPILQPDEPPLGADIRLDVGSGGGDRSAADDHRIGTGPSDGKSGAGDGVGFFGARAQGDSFVFVVDCSGSMHREGRFILAKREIYQALSTMRPQQSFFLYLYNNHSRPMLDGNGPTSLTPATRKTQNEVRSWLRPLQPGGGTQPIPALQQALELEPEVLFFLTDGEIPDETVEIARAATRQETVIHTISLGSREGKVILREIAEASGGSYRHVSAMSEFNIERLSDRENRSLEERAADAKLRQALQHLNHGRLRTGRRWLERVVSEHPGTTQARNAQKLLSAI